MYPLQLLYPVLSPLAIGPLCNTEYVALAIFLCTKMFVVACSGVHEKCTNCKVCITGLAGFIDVGSAALLRTVDTPCDPGTCLFSPLP